MVAFFYYQSILLTMYGILMVGKKMDEVHWRIPNEQQYGKPDCKNVFRYFQLHLFIKTISLSYTSKKLTFTIAPLRP